MSATGSSPRRSRSQSTSMSYQPSPTHPSSKRAFSAAASPRIIGPRGKRARRNDSPSPTSSPVIILSDLSNPVSAAPMPSPLTTVFTSLVSSAPATPLLPSSSSAFFPATASSISHRDSHMRSSSPLPSHSRVKLDDLHREAFTSLRQSLAQSGEGFLRRMRDWEQRRNMESTKASMLGTQERGRDRRRARRRRTLHTDNHPVGGMSAPQPGESCLFSVDIPHADMGSGDMSGYGTFLGEQDESDVEDVMLIDIVGHPLSLAPERKSRSVSLGRSASDIPGPQELYAVDLAGNDAERYPSARYTSTFEFPSTYSTTRSSSPFSLGNTSDDESSSGSRYDQSHSGFSSPCAMSNSLDWSSHTVHARNQSTDTSPRRSSPGFSRGRLTSQCHMTVQSLDDTSLHKNSRLAAVSETGSRVPQTASDTALAALVLALANGSGSLADYGYVRDAQGELEEHEAGALWE